MEKGNTAKREKREESRQEDSPDKELDGEFYKELVLFHNNSF